MKAWNKAQLSWNKSLRQMKKSGSSTGFCWSNSKYVWQHLFFSLKNFSKTNLTFTSTLAILNNIYSTQANHFLQPHTTQANINQITVSTLIDWYKYSKMMNDLQYSIKLEQWHIISDKITQALININ